MKSVLFAAAISLVALGAAKAAEPSLLEQELYTGETMQVTNAYWIGRYGQRCYHGPVWFRACHGTNHPGTWIPGHWNPMRTRYIPGHYA